MAIRIFDSPRVSDQDAHLSWRGLIPGLLIVTILVATALLILVRVGLGNIPGKKFTIYALTDEARGILRGSDIWLAGQRVGFVSDVKFLPAVSATTQPNESRILMQLAILSQYQNLIGRNSRAQVRTGTRILGNPVLHVSLGTIDQPTIVAGDTIYTLPQFDPDEMAANLEAVMALFPQMKRDLTLVLSSASHVDSIMTLIAPDPTGTRRSALQSLIVALQELIPRLDQGSLGSFMHDSTLMTKVRSASAATTSMMGRFDIPQSSLGRFVSDTTLIPRIDSIAVTFQSILSTYESKFNFKSGSRAEALRLEIDRLNQSLRALRDDAKRHPFRYIVF